MPEFRDQRLQIVIAGAGAIQLPAYFAELPLDPLHAVPDILARAAEAAVSFANTGFLQTPPGGNHAPYSSGFEDYSGT
jgi:hypothetical protein